ncbi:MAG: alpha/beta hydrolase [Chitinophagaceae bacterium]
MKIIILLGFVHILFTVAPVRAAIKDTTLSVPSSVYFNVAYGADPKQVMDIYLPSGRSVNTTKLMFLVHGGSWSGGDKNGFKPYIDSLSRHLTDYAFVNLNYRLANATQNKFPAQENDVKAAMDFVIKKSAEYHVSQNVVLLGASAGAHLALLQAYKYSYPVKVKAVISFFGPSDFNYMYENPMFPQVPQLLELLLGGNPSNNKAAYEQSSPINFVTAQSCPSLLFQGGKDPLVNPKQSELLKDKLEKEGVPAKLVVYPNEGHGWRGPLLGDSFDKITTFLQENVP